MKREKVKFVKITKAIENASFPFTGLEKCTAQIGDELPDDYYYKEARTPPNFKPENTRN